MWKIQSSPWIFLYLQRRSDYIGKRERLQYRLPYCYGTDTIDRYPLCASGAVKILCITPKVWGEIYQNFEAFRKLIKGPAPRKVLEQASRTKAKGVAKNEYQAAYEPTNAIRCNDADRRRWARVKEWFNEYPSDNDATRKTAENWKEGQIS